MRYVPYIPHFSDEENRGNNNPLAWPSSGNHIDNGKELGCFTDQPVHLALDPISFHLRKDSPGLGSLNYHPLCCTTSFSLSTAPFSVWQKKKPKPLTITFLRTFPHAFVPFQNKQTNDTPEKSGFVTIPTSSPPILHLFQNTHPHHGPILNQEWPSYWQILWSLL